MSAPDPASSVLPAPVIPTRARALAARLAALFTADQQLVCALNDAHDLLAAANDRLWAGLVVAGPEVHWQIHDAFCAYQSAGEKRRQLAVDVGELSVQLTDALCAAGLTAQQARAANVDRLADGTWPASDPPKEAT